MATRKQPADSAAPDVEVMITTLTRVLNRLIVNASFGPGSVGFRQICTQQLHIASDAEVDVIEAWMTAHTGG